MIFKNESAFHLCRLEPLTTGSRDCSMWKWLLAWQPHLLVAEGGVFSGDKGLNQASRVWLSPPPEALGEAGGGSAKE